MDKAASKKKADHRREYDLVVIGSGPAGIHAAVQGAKLQKRVCIIEKMTGKLGGAWLQTGTLPSKTIRESLEAINNIRFHVGNKWVDRVISELSAAQLFGRARTVANGEEELIHKHLANNGIELLHGMGLLESDTQVRVIPPEGPSLVLDAKNILIATGSRPRRPDDVPFDGWRIVDSDEILLLETVPKKIIVYGAGVIGCEYACIFASLGVDTTVIDSRAHVMQSMDYEVVAELRKAMEAIGVKFHLQCRIDDIKVSGPIVSLRFGSKVEETNVLFFAAGRLSNSEHLGLQRLGIDTDEKGTIKVDENFQTQVAGIYACGDVIGAPALAATSSNQGRHAVLHAFGHRANKFPEVFPIGVYTIPEMSAVGKTEEQLKEEGADYVVGRALYAEIARGNIRGDSFGLLKLLISKTTHRILGIHIVGQDACNLVHIGLAYMSQQCPAQELVQHVFNYPTLAEGYRIAAFNGLNKIFTSGVIGDPPVLDKRAPRAA